MTAGDMRGDPHLSLRAEARVGSIVRGKYRLDSVLGIGGMAVVYAATHRNAKRFAVKMLHSELSLNADIRTRFLREGYAANSVGHPGTVAVLDDDVAEDGAAFIVMELLHGASVDVVWQRCGGQLGVGAAVAIADQLLDVLCAAHGNGIIHRDIKPANLFVVEDGTVKVLDFGIARARDAAASVGGAHGTTTGVLLGTPAFMAPEQALAKSSEIDAQSDVWATGATLFTLLSGRLVHQGDNAQHLLVLAATEHPRPLMSVAPNVPRAIADVVDRGLAFAKAKRWRSAVEMRDALRAAHLAVYAAATRRVPLDSMLSEARTGAPAPPAIVTKTQPRAEVESPPDLADAGRPGSSRAARRVAGAVTERQLAIGNATTESPVAAIAAPRTGPFWKRTSYAVGLGAGVLAIAASLAGWWYHGSIRTTAAMVSDTSTAGFVVASSAAAITTVEATTPGATSASAATVKGPITSPPIAVTDLPLARAVSSPPVRAAISTPVVPATSRAVPVRPPVPSASAAVSARPTPTINCDPPFYFDSQGSRIFKKACL